MTTIIIKAMATANTTPTALSLILLNKLNMKQTSKRTSSLMPSQKKEKKKTTTIIPRQNAKTSRTKHPKPALKLNAKRPWDPRPPHAHLGQGGKGVKVREQGRKRIRGQCDKGASGKEGKWITGYGSKGVIG